MDKLIALERRIVPEMGELLHTRYLVLRHVYFSQPVGRRALASDLEMQERRVRREVDVLRRQGLVNITTAGIVITGEGEAVVWDLEEYIRLYRDLNGLEDTLARTLGLKTVRVVAGDIDRDPMVKKALARAAAALLLQTLQEGDTLAISGGTTMAEVAAALPPSTRRRDVLVVPARGGLAEDVEIQANTVAAALAKNLGGKYRLFHLPDVLDQDVLERLMAEPGIREQLEVIRNARVVMHGIGTADDMARRRGASEEVLALLKRNGAVGEAFGYYFNRTGEVVYATSSAGIQVSDLADKEVVAVAGGGSKAAAILAAVSLTPPKALVIDEGVATHLVDMLKGE